MIVVDTHAVLWLTQEQELLSATAAMALGRGRADGELAIADITLHELSILVSKRRIWIDRPLLVYLQFVESVFRVLPINARISERAMQFQLPYPNDPADRLIGATALVYGAELVTKDKLIRDSGEVSCIW